MAHDWNVTKLGERLREARQTKGWSLRALGERTGFSASFHSQVELGQSSPSLASLEKIASALGLSLSDVIANKPEPSPLLRKANRDGLRSEWSRAYVESLLPSGSDEHLEALLLRLDAEGRTGERKISPRSKLFAYVTAGAATLVLTEPSEELAVETGDSIVVEGPRGVCWENRSTERIEILAVTARVI
ncbi:MAG: putative HTH-type transcriptional regulator [Myxococcaceae bacterium]|nr:putative HTH-type transcriptional regulator [Myxococcaceae bacterium]